MKKSEMQERFRQLLERRKLMLREAVAKKKDSLAVMHYGAICGMAEAMRELGLIDWEQKRFIKDEAWALVTGKETEYEAC